MAEDVKRIIDIDGGKAIQTLRDLKQAADESANQLEEIAAVSGTWSTEYQKQLVETKRAQKDYNSALTLTVNAANSVKSSYYDLNKQLVEARKAWKNLSESERNAASGNELLMKIKGLDTQLKELDREIGQNQRNVGDYAGQMSKIAGLFGSAGGAAKGAVSGVMNFKAALDAASATPIIAIIGAIITILSKVKESFSKSEAGVRALTEAFAPFKVAGQLVQTVCEKIALGLASMVKGLTKVLDKLGLVSAKMKENQAIAQEETALLKRRRELEVDSAKQELIASEARNKAADKATYSAQERLAFLRQAEAAEKAILANELEIANKEYDLAKRKAALSPNDTATNDELAKMEADLYRAETSYNDGMRRITSQMSTARQEIAAEAAGAAGDVAAQAGVAAQVSDAIAASIEEEAARLAKAEEAEIQAMLKADEDTNKRAQKRAENRLAEIDAAAAHNIVMLEAEVMSATEREDAVWAIQQDAAQRRLALLEQERQAALDRGDLDSALALEQQIADQKVAITEDEVRRKQKLREQEQQSQQQDLKSFQSYANAASSVLGSVAGAWQNAIRAQVEAGELSEEEAEEQFEMTKVFQYAQTLINTIAGAVAAFAAPDNVTQAQKWAQFAAVMASGMASVVSIATTKYGSTSTSAATTTAASAASAAAPSIDTTPTTSRLLTTGTDLEELNQTIKVAVVYSDIEAAGAHTAEVTSESSF